MFKRMFSRVIVEMVMAVAICAGLSERCLAGGTAYVDGSIVRVTVEWSAGGNPVHGTDFIVEFSDETKPVIELREGDLEWRVHAQIISTGAPANIESITTTDSEHYGVQIADDSGGPGAANVGTLNLDPAGDHHSSILSGSRITGNLTGALSVVSDSSDDGGVIDGLTIDGNVTSSASITTPVVKSLTISGDLAGDLEVTVKIEGTLAVVGVVASTAAITIDDMVEVNEQSSTAEFCTDWPSTFAGSLILTNGVPAHGDVNIWGALSQTSSVDLNDQDLAGTLRLMGGGSGVLTGVADVVGAAELRLAHLTDHKWSGTATIGQVSSPNAAIITGNDRSVDGYITIEGDMNGTLWILGSLLSGGRIVITGETTGSVTVSVDVSSGARIELGSGLAGSAMVDVWDDLAGEVVVTGDCNGDIDIGDQVDSSGKIEIGENLASGGSIAVGGLLDGDIVINGDAAGDIALASAMRYGSSVTVGGGLAGAMSINGNVNGDIAVAGGLTGSIGAAYALTSTGRILLDGACAGPITIGRDTASTSLIRAIGGLTSC